MTKEQLEAVVSGLARTAIACTKAQYRVQCLIAAARGILSLMNDDDARAQELLGLHENLIDLYAMATETANQTRSTLAEAARALGVPVPETKGTIH